MVTFFRFHLGKSGCRFKNTILFVAFDFEEDTAESEHPIPFGSQYFVQNLTEYLSQTGGTVQGAFILEMLANHNASKGNMASLYCDRKLHQVSKGKMLFLNFYTIPKRLNANYIF